MDIAKLRSLAEAATPGPWHWHSDPVKGDPLNRSRYEVVATGRTITRTYYSGDMAERESAYIAAANPAAVLELIEAIERRGATIAAMSTEMAELRADAVWYRWIEDNASTQGGGQGFTIFVPVDHEDMGCGIDAAMAAGNKPD